MNVFRSTKHRLYRFLADTRFMRVIVIVFVLQAAWIALSGLYPMAFDEDFHLGIIRLYAHHISPFWGSHAAPGGGTFGAVARDPSYMYQYLLSFPYRFLSLWTHNQTTIVLWLRFLNIALLAAALPIYRKLLLKTGASRRIVHLCLLVFVFLPIVPLLAAQINYDNLFIPLIGAALLLAIDVKEQMKKTSIPVQKLCALILLCIFTSLVKYAFLPIFLAIVVYLLWYARKAYPSLKRFSAALTSGWRVITLRTRWILVVLGIVMLGLFSERYVLNVTRYHAPIPKCEQVLTIKQCSTYGPWVRDYDASINNIDNDKHPSTIDYMGDWFYGMWLRTFFAVDGPTTDFQTRGPLPVPAQGAVVVAVISAVAFVVAFKKVMRRYDTSVLIFFGLVTCVYVTSLLQDEYKAYLKTGQPVAINGRYLLPIVLCIMIVAALSLREALRRYKYVSILAATSIVVCGMWGGGALTYILRSNDAWYWPNSTVLTVNHAVQKALKPVVPGTDKPTEFLH